MRNTLFYGIFSIVFLSGCVHEEHSAITFDDYLVKPRLIDKKTGEVAGGLKYIEVMGHQNNPSGVDQAQTTGFVYNEQTRDLTQVVQNQGNGEGMNKFFWGGTGAAFAGGTMNAAGEFGGNYIFGKSLPNPVAPKSSITLNNGSSSTNGGLMSTNNAGGGNATGGSATGGNAAGGNTGAVSVHANGGQGGAGGTGGASTIGSGAIQNHTSNVDNVTSSSKTGPQNTDVNVTSKTTGGSADADAGAKAGSNSSSGIFGRHN